MKTYRIALLRGDGIGQPLMEFWREALPLVAERCGFAAECTVLPFGKSARENGDVAIPDSTLDGIKAADAALLAAVDAKGVGESPIGRLRSALDLYADVRPIKTWPGRWAHRPDLDLVCIRESTQGFLPDRNLFAGRGEFMPDADTALSLRVVTREASVRIARYAFNYARRYGRKRITALHKESIFTMTCGMFLSACREVAKDYSDIIFDADLIDNAANRLIRAPESLDVLLTTNLFGDIISDEAAALVSSLAPSANIGDCATVFMPVNHQPEYAALESDTYDPMPAALCAHMLFSMLGENEAANRVERGILTCLASGERQASRLLDLLHKKLEASE